MPRVSVIIPSYNHAKFLRACIQSVRAQTFEDWEIVLVDDGSKDGSVAMAQEIAVEEPRLRVFENRQNLGTYGTQAKAKELATGDLLCVLNSDDLWEPMKLATQVTLMERHSALECCYTLGWLVDEEGKIRKEDVHDDWPQDLIQELLPFLLSENRILASSVMFRRAAASFDPSLRYSGDWVALLKCARRGAVGCVPARLSHWRQHPNNTYLRSEAQTIEEIRVRQSILGSPDWWFVDRIPQVRIRSGLSRCALDLAALYVLVGRMPDARRAALLATRLATRKRQAFRRYLASQLPKARARARLWPEQPGFDLSDAFPKQPPINWEG